ncbi:MAG TPA: SGNH/GDSL hydrolase family protein [Vicinamibacterales bacterium]|nr:SGNH/GDSL hydrolase family protein [Vicinamibacterales bacterium]
MRIRATTFLAAAAVLAVATATVPTAAQAPLRRIVVFGTSLSDSGNAFALRGGTNTPPDYVLDPLLVPSAPYARGGHHFSNGATWIEQFAQSRGLAGSVRPAFLASDSNATNYAVGGARAHEDGVNVNLSAQVDALLRQFSGRAPADALYTIEMGGNDIRDALVAYAAGRNGGPIIQEAVLSIARNIQVLYGAGAREFLVWRAPNVALTPAIRTLDRLKPGAAHLTTQLTQAFNAGLDGAVTQLAGLPEIRIVRLDAYGLLNDLVTYPAAFGLTDVTTACVTPNVPPFTCERPDEFLFWDGLHPTRAAHAIIAQEAASLLAR